MPHFLDLLPFAQAQPQGFREIIDNLARTPLSEVVKFVAVLTAIRLVLYPLLKSAPPHKRGAGFGLARFINEVLDAFVYAGVFVFMLIRPFAVQAFLIPSGSMFPTLYVNDFIVANKAIYRYSEPKVGDIVVFRPPNYAATSDQIGEDGKVKVDFIKRLIGGPGDVIEFRDGELYRNGQPARDPWRHFAQQTSPNDFMQIPESHASSLPDFKIVYYDGPYEPWKGRYIPVVTEDRPGDPLPNFQANIAREFAVGTDPSDQSNNPMQINWKSPYELSQEERERISYLRRAEPAAIPKDHYLMVGDNRNGSFDGRYWGLIGRDQVIGRSEFIWLPITRWGMTR